MSSPSKITRPDEGRISPATELSTVLLPEPERPTSAVTVPGSSRSEIGPIVIPELPWPSFLTTSTASSSSMPPPLSSRL